jgi:hypothetical protein
MWCSRYPPAPTLESIPGGASLDRGSRGPEFSSNAGLACPKPRLARSRSLRDVIQSGPNDWGLHFVEGLAVFRVLVALFGLLVLVAVIWSGFWLAGWGQGNASSAAAVMAGMAALI